MSNAPEELGFLELVRIPGDFMVEDDVGEWRCRACRRSLAELEEKGHAGGCEVRDRLVEAQPRGELRRRVVAEWPGLELAILSDHDLRANLVGAIVEAYRTDFKRAKKRNQKWTETRAKVGKAFAELEALLRDEVNPLVERLATLERKVLGWWSVGDQLDGRGGPPRQKKRGR